jgi:hypothetical protein
MFPLLRTLCFGIGSYLSTLFLNFPTSNPGIPIGRNEYVGGGTPSNGGNAIVAHISQIAIIRSNRFIIITTSGGGGTPKRRHIIAGRKNELIGLYIVK